jgi:diguanylate cyclase (GGDEF)-like protein
LAVQSDSYLLCDSVFKLSYYSNYYYGLVIIKFKTDLVILCLEFEVRYLHYFLIDLDHFKFVNDHYGKEIGDKLLKYVVGVVKDVLREYDFFARLKGDIFAVILNKIQHVEQINAIANRILVQFSLVHLSWLKNMSLESVRVLVLLLVNVARSHLALMIWLKYTYLLSL